MSRAPLRVAVLGAGTVGREVVRGLVDGRDRLARLDAAVLELAGIAVRDVARARDAGLPAALLTDAPAHLVADPSIDVVVELMGGDEPARTLVGAALGAGKAVVTANKHIVAHHGPELEATARRARAPFRFEAAVGGGIPILAPLASGLAADRVSRVRGIVNGTTNWILSAMADDADPLGYDDALARAQAAGYAEADPTGDVEGLDAVNKLVILARLAFDVWLDPATVETTPTAAGADARPGIRGVTAEDLAAIRSEGRMLRLVAEATRLDGDEVAASVLPTAVLAASPFGRTGGVTNRIEVDAEPLGRVAFEGPGAGGAATSSAVLGDLLAIAAGRGSTWDFRPSTVSRVAARTRPSGVYRAGPSGQRYPLLADEVPA